MLEDRKRRHAAVLQVDGNSLRPARRSSPRVGSQTISAEERGNLIIGRHSGFGATPGHVPDGSRVLLARKRCGSNDSSASPQDSDGAKGGATTFFPWRNDSVTIGASTAVAG